jgi:hypothetical protein
VVTNGSTGFSQSHYFGVRRRVRGRDVAIPSASYNLAVAHNHRSHRHLCRLEGTLGAAEGFLHPKLIGMKFDRGGLGCPVCRFLGSHGDSPSAVF